jgi:hypothetical protein
MMRLGIYAVTAMLIFLCGAAASYAVFVPKKNAEIARMQQSNADAHKEFITKEAEYDSNFKKVKAWYIAAIARIKHDSVQHSVPAANTEGTVAKSAEGINDPIAQSGFDPSRRDVALTQMGLDPVLMDMFLNGKSFEYRVSACQEDAARVTGLQMLLTAANIPVE